MRNEPAGKFDQDAMDRITDIVLSHTPRKVRRNRRNSVVRDGNRAGYEMPHDADPEENHASSIT